MNKWRWGVTLLALFAIALFAVACGDDDDDNGGATTPAGDETPSDNGSDNGDNGDSGEDENGDESDRMGGDVTIQYSEHDSFDPHFTTFAQSIGVTGMVFRGMYNLDADNEVVPEMAADMPEVSDDGTTYTVTLQDGLEWSDGDDLTAEDFVAAFERSCNFEVGSGYQYVLSNVVGCDDYYNPDNAELSDEEQEELRGGIGVTAVDETTVEIELNNPQPTFPIILNMWVTWPVPTHIVDGPAAEWPAPEELVFNGPFQVDTYTAGDQIALVRNESYAGEHLAYLDQITLQYIDDNETANNAYRNGELHAVRANTSQLSALEGEFPDELVSLPTASTIALQMNHEAEPLGDENVRRALGKAIDRETLNEVVLQGAHVPTTSWIPPEIARGGVETDSFADAIGFDPEGAAELMEEAGYPNGEGFPTLSIIVRDTPSNTATAEFLQENFAEILNIEIEIDIVDAPTRASRFTNEEFELFPGGWVQDYPDPENWIVGLFDSEGGLNHYNCTNDRIDEIVEEALFNTDNEERQELYREANEIIATTACGGTPMYHQGTHYLVSPELQGAREHADSKDRVIAGDWIVEEWYLED